MMKIEILRQKVDTISSAISFSIERTEGGIEFKLHAVSKCFPLYYSSTHERIRFASADSMRRQLERLNRRIHERRRPLTSAPWSRCWPPYRQEQRSQSFYLGSLFDFNRSRRKEQVRYCVFAFTPGKMTPLTWVSRHLGEAVHLLPANFFSKVLDGLISTSL